MTEEIFRFSNFVLTVHMFAHTLESRFLDYFLYAGILDAIDVLGFDFASLLFVFFADIFEKFISLFLLLEVH